MIRFKFLTGDVDWQTYGGQFISQKLNNGDFDYWLVLNFINMHEATGDEETDKYHVTILAVSPELNIQEADALIEDYGVNLPITDEMRVGALANYVIAAHLKGFSGNNYSSLMKEAKKEAQVIPLLFGFYMDRPQNAIGSTGWDCIRGDIMAGLDRYKASEGEQP